MVGRLSRTVGTAALLTAVGASLLAGAATAAADAGQDGATSQSESPASDTAGPSSAAPPALRADKVERPALRTVRTAAGTRARTVKRATVPARRQQEEKDEIGFIPSEVVSEPAVRDATAAPERVTAAAPVSTATVVAPAAAAVQPAAPPAHVQKFFRAVGSAALNALMGLIQLFAGPPILPANSTVTVRTSMLTIPVGTGRRVKADWYFPENGGEPPERLIYLQHGFGAASSMYSYNAAALAQRTNSVVVAPTLTSNFLDAGAVWLGGTPLQSAVAELFAGNRGALTESASAAVGYQVVLPRRFAMVGHSLGATLVMGAAAGLVDNAAIDDLAGVVLFDGVDVNNTVPRALDRLVGADHVPVHNISSERYQWNRYGLVSDELQAARPGEFNGVMLAGGRHIDGLQGGNPLLQFAEYLVAGFSEARNIEAVRTLSAGWINDMFAGTTDGIYPAPGQSVQIPASGIPAIAVALPIESTQPVRVTPWDGVMAAILAAIAKFAVYDPPSASEPLIAG